MCCATIRSDNNKNHYHTHSQCTSTFSPIETKAVIAANAQHRRQSTSATRDQITWSLDTRVVTSWSEVNALHWNSGRHHDAYYKTRPHQVERFWQLCVCWWCMPVFPQQTLQCGVLTVLAFVVFPSSPKSSPCWTSHSSCFSISPWWKKKRNRFTG